MFPFLLRGARGNVGLTLGALRYFKDFDFMFVMGHEPGPFESFSGQTAHCWCDCTIRPQLRHGNLNSQSFSCCFHKS
jgi:hypothetical protein